MKILKKIIALCLVMALPYTYPCTRAEQSNTVLDEVVYTLSELGIYDSSELDIDNIITRAEFAALISRIVTNRGENAFTSFDSMPSDVAPDHWAYDYIGTLVSSKIMSGYENNRFLPEYPLTYEQLATVLVKVVGRDAAAIGSGGYPLGYFSVAHSLGLLRSINVSGSTDSVTAREVLQILYRLLDTTVTQVRKVSGDHIYFEADDETTVARYYLKLVRLSGVVYANEVTSLADHSAGLKNGEILIDGIRVKGNEVDKYLGRNVTVYYDEDDEKKEIKYIIKNKKNSEHKVHAKNISSASNTSYLIELNENETKNSYEIDDFPSVILNGKAIDTAFTNEMLRIDDGEITVIDNDSDGVFEVVIIDDLTVMVISETDLELGIIYSKYAESDIVIGDDDTLRIESGSERIDLSSVKADTIALVGMSKNATGSKHINLFLSNKCIPGTVEEISQDEIVISGTKYELSDYARSNAEITPKLGNTGTFYFDAYGRIAVFAAGLSDSPYAFVIGAATENGLKGKLKIKLMNAAGEINVYEASDTVIVDGRRMKSMSNVLARLEEACALLGEQGVRQVIRCKYSEDNSAVTEIDTVVADENDNSDSAFKADSNYIRFSSKYYVTNKCFDREFALTTASVIFYAPISEDEKYYTVVPAANIPNGVELVVTAYDVNDLNVARTIAVDSSYSFPVSYTSEPGIVKRIFKGLTEDGDAATFIELLDRKNKAGINIELLGSLNENSIKVGEVIRCHYDTLGRVYSVEKLFSPYDRDRKEKEGVLSIDGTRFTRIGTSYVAVVGELYAYVSAEMRITTVNTKLADLDDVTSVELEPNYVKNSTYFLCDFSNPSNAKVSTGSALDMKPYKQYGNDCSIVVTRCRAIGAPYEVFIYNGMN